MPEQEQPKFTTKKVGLTTVVRLVGPRITEPVYISELSDELLAVLETAHPRDLLLDLDEVAYLSSSVLGKVLVRLLKRTRDMGGRLRLADGDIFRVMRIARQHGLLTMMHAENGDIIDILVSEALQAGP